ncbi:MAG: DUF4037 domain-containing protein [Acidobacteriota bacterium]|nr:DUF4037 domain-containing protein [Acidobacteriota bacterium]
MHSTDHHWRPRFLPFLSDEDYKTHKDSIFEALSKNLPYEFHGYSTNFGLPDEGHVRVPLKIESGPVHHMISIETIESFFGWYLGANPHAEITKAEWLTFSEHKLLAVTGGKVFHDDLGLKVVRQKFSYYPRLIWLYQLSCQWNKIAEDEEFVGRCGDIGDELGSMIIAARQIKNLMKLCFLMERKYAPYSKWFGRAFSELNCAQELNPVFIAALLASFWREREKHLSHAYEIVARLHNELHITKHLDQKVSNYGGRPYLVVHAGAPATPYNEVVYLESLRKKGSFLLKFAMPPDFLSSNSDAAQITGLSVRFECDDAGAN